MKKKNKDTLKKIIANISKVKRRTFGLESKADLQTKRLLRWLP